MAVPGLYQFPNFVEAVTLLKENRLQCIWYLPNKERRCMVGITYDDNERAFQMAQDVLQSSIRAKTALQTLTSIAEMSCCLRHHRNKVYGTGLAKELAEYWQSEIRVALGFKTMNLSPEDEFARTGGVQFSKHQAHHTESLLSSLLLNLDSNAPPTGSVYYYSHDASQFIGMIKIGYSGNRTIRYRLDEWADCGHGYPVLLGHHVDVRHPKRVELLIHFELVEQRHALRWCKFHRSAHIEWFKIDLDKAIAVVSDWCEWMRRADPYNRRGELTPTWTSHIMFLLEHSNPITAEALVQIQEIEEGSDVINEFIDDKALRRRRPKLALKEVMQFGAIKQEPIPAKAEVKHEDEPIKLPPAALAWYNSLSTVPAPEPDRKVEKLKDASNWTLEDPVMQKLEDLTKRFNLHGTPQSKQPPSIQDSMKKLEEMTKSLKLTENKLSVQSEVPKTLEQVRVGEREKIASDDNVKREDKTRAKSSETGVEEKLAGKQVLNESLNETTRDAKVQMPRHSLREERLENFGRRYSNIGSLQTQIEEVTDKLKRLGEGTPTPAADDTPAFSQDERLANLGRRYTTRSSNRT